MKRRNPTTASLTKIEIRCTTGERSTWKRLAARRGSSLSDIVRRGLTTASLGQCLCTPGEPVCLKCSQPGNSPA